VQLHELTGVVLVESSLALQCLRKLRTLLGNNGRPSGCGTPLHGAYGAERRASTVGHTLPVVQVVEHRRTLGDRTEQFAERAHGVRTDRLRVVLRDEIARAILAREDVEVILPEVDHHFVQLTFGDDGARHAAARDLTEKRVRLAAACLQFGGVFRRDFAAVLPSQLCQLHTRRWVLGQQGFARLTQSGKALQELCGSCIIDALRLELPRDPGIHAHRPHGRDVARTRPEGQPVEDVLDLLVRRLFAKRQIASGRRDAALRSGHGCAGRRRAGAQRRSQRCNQRNSRRGPDAPRAGRASGPRALPGGNFAIGERHGSLREREKQRTGIRGAQRVPSTTCRARYAGSWTHRLVPC
jgi:hypothetical protein